MKGYAFARFGRRVSKGDNNRDEIIVVWLAGRQAAGEFGGARVEG